MPRVVEVTKVRLLELKLDATRDCIIVKYAEEDAAGRAIAFGKMVFFDEYPGGRGPFENWQLMEKQDVQAVRKVARVLMGKISKALGMEEE